jgi:hypothetical protein
VKIIAKKVDHRKLNASNGVPPDQLKVIHAVRTLGDERKLGQYKLIEDGKTKYFKNFLELRYYSDLVLYTKHKHVIISRGEIQESNENLC